MKTTTEELIELAKTILSQNPKCLLSGSLALHMQEISTRRQPADLDIYLPMNEQFNPIAELKNVDYDNSKNDYADNGFERIQYQIFNGKEIIKVDVFTPIEDNIPVLIQADMVLPVNCVRFDDIIKFKTYFAMGKHHSSYKHKDDIIHILINNENIVD